MNKEYKNLEQLAPERPLYDYFISSTYQIIFLPPFPGLSSPHLPHFSSPLLPRIWLLSPSTKLRGETSGILLAYSSRGYVAT